MSKQEPMFPEIEEHERKLRRDKAISNFMLLIAVVLVATAAIVIGVM